MNWAEILLAGALAGVFGLLGGAILVALKVLLDRRGP